MPVQMKPHQLEFWQELLAPFSPDQLSTTRRGGKELTYIDKRSITNRLDSVCGPHGWYPEFEATSRGYKCRLSILVPTDNPAAWIFMAKEDGAGFEEMGAKNKETGEFEYDVDNDEKSGYTNALRRAAQDAWGIGRYLYGKGIPTFLNPNATAPGIGQVQPHQAEAPSAPAKPTPTPAPTKPATTASGAPDIDWFKIPRAGKPVFAWGYKMESTFSMKLVSAMCNEGESKGYGSNAAEWNQEQVDDVVLGAMAYIRDQPSYGKQFEKFFPEGSTPTTPVQTGPTPGVNLADLRKELATKIGALHAHHTGKEATKEENRSAFSTISSSTKNSSGHSGEVADSLNKLTDEVWIKNMIAFVDGKIVEALAAKKQDDDPIGF